MDSRSWAGSMHAPHAAPATAGDGLDEDREAQLVGGRDQRVDVAGGLGRPQHRHAGLARGLDRAGLVAGQLEDVGARPDEGDARFLARARELGVLRQEAVTGVDGVGPRLLRGARRSRRPRGRRAPDDRARRSRTPRRPSAGAGSCGPRAGTRRRSPRPVRSRRGTLGSRSPRGWPPAPCGTCPVLPVWIGKSPHVTRFFPLCGSSVPGDGHHAPRKVRRESVRAASQDPGGA